MLRVTPPSTSLCEAWRWGGQLGLPGLTRKKKCNDTVKTSLSPKVASIGSRAEDTGIFGYHDSAYPTADVSSASSSLFISSLLSSCFVNTCVLGRMQINAICAFASLSVSFFLSKSSTIPESFPFLPFSPLLCQCAVGFCFLFLVFVGFFFFLAVL